MLKNNQKELLLLQDLGMIYPDGKSNKKYRYAIYKCFCGSEFKAQVYNINKKYTKSCGCLKNKNKIDLLNKRFTNGFTNHRLYNIWNTMFHRCYNPKRKDYKDYGLRGIIVCNEWLKIENFINDMYPTFQEGLTLDRINNNLGYSKDNCKWSTKSSQVRNTRKLYKNNTTNYRGVYKKDKKYIASVGIFRKRKRLGTFSNPIDAAKARDKYIIENGLEHTLNFK